ncbi:MAG: amphi-Trp domain-containing protein [Nannocystaceae bacterium]
MSKKEVRFSAAVTREQAIAALEQLTAALRAGPVRVAAGDRSLVIAPRDVIGLDLEVSHKPGKSKLELELSWRELDADEGDLGLVIEPAPESEAAAEGDDDGDDGDAEEAEEADDDDDDDDDAGEDAPAQAPRDDEADA